MREVGVVRPLADQVADGGRIEPNKKRCQNAQLPQRNCLKGGFTYARWLGFHVLGLHLLNHESQF